MPFPGTTSNGGRGQRRLPLGADCHNRRRFRCLRHRSTGSNSVIPMVESCSGRCLIDRDDSNLKGFRCRSDKHHRRNRDSLQSFPRGIPSRVAETCTERARATPITLGLFVSLLREGFAAEPVPFDPGWSKHARPPRNHWVVPVDIPRLWLHADKEELTSLRSRTDEFECFVETLLFQIADLHSMTSRQMEDKWKYLGLKSPRGNDWYNWDPVSYLEQGTAGLLAHLERNHLVGADDQPCNWATFAFFLEMGRLWE